eukprot:269919-Pelagomonas_calceolata.AAC.2
MRDGSSNCFHLTSDTAVARPGSQAGIVDRCSKGWYMRWSPGGRPFLNTTLVSRLRSFSFSFSKFTAEMWIGSEML